MPEQLLILRDAGGAVLREYSISTAKAGLGSEPGSHRTPVGRFRIVRKIGGGAHPDMRFRSREEAGLWDGQPSEEDFILSRILWLDGLEEQNASTYSRFIYIHGTNQEDRLGTPASHGCIRMSRSDVVDLYDLVPEGAGVVILPESREIAQKFMRGQPQGMRYDGAQPALSPDQGGATITQENSGLGRTSMEYYQDSYRNDSGSQDSYGGGGQDRRDSYRGGGGGGDYRQSSPPLITEKIVTERKQFFLDLKENNRGRVLKITEDVRGRRDTIMVPIEVLQDFYEALGRIMDYERGLE